MTSVADADRLRVRWQRQLVAGTSVAEDVPAVPAVMLQTEQAQLPHAEQQEANAELSEAFQGH